MMGTKTPGKISLIFWDMATGKERNGWSWTAWTANMFYR